MKLWVDKTVWVSERAPQKISHLRPEAIESIAVIKHGALGDMVLTRPFFITLRHYFNNARITLSAVSHYLNGVPHDLIDHLHIAFGKNERGESLRKVLQSYKALGKQDLIFDLTCNARSLWTAFFNKASLKIGFIPSGGHKYFYKILYDIALPRSEYKFEAETFLDQLNVLGLSYEWPLRFDLPRGKRPLKAPYILYFPGASDPYKCWPADHFITLIRTMCRQYRQFRHLVLGGLQEWEKDLADQIVAQLVNSAPVERVMSGGEETFEFITHAQLLISNDTGIRNYAIAAGVPTLGIFFATLPFRYLPRFGKHRVAFELHGGTPDVETVCRYAAEILTNKSNFIDGRKNHA